jgi:hypothetical protein
VWTGSELLVWGGWNSDGGATRDGFAYTPSTHEVELIPPAPIEPRAQSTATWTGSELLIWGGADDEESPYSDGAAYDPETKTWRTLASSPLTWYDLNADTWTGTEWWVASQLSGDGTTEIAVYTPATDSWRSLPAIPDEYADTPVIAWTGTEILLLTAAGLFSLPAGASEWVLEREPSDLGSPGAWTGDLLVLATTAEIGEDALGSDYLAYPIGWDPETRSSVDLPLPPRNVYDTILADSRLLYPSQHLAFDLIGNEWVALDLDRATRQTFELVGYTSIWAGDRLLVWGGVDACGGHPPKRNFVHELIPQWDEDESGGGIAPPAAPPAGARTMFAC